jgi:hypothetical protein
VRVLSCDPGGSKKGNAVALFVDGVLKGTDVWTIGEERNPAWADVVVVEQMVFSRHRNTDANDLIDVAMGGGFVVGWCSHSELVMVKPQDWKGSRPKKVDNAYTKSLLSADELAILPTKMTSDLWDAVGIGLWHLKRR